MKKTHINATGALLASVRQTLLLAVLFLSLGTANGNEEEFTTSAAPAAPAAPEITSTPTLIIPYGQPYNYSITATGDDTLPTTLTAEVLPDWLDFSPGDASEATAFGNIPAGKYMVGVAGDDQGNVYAITNNGTEIYKIAPDGNTSSWKSGLTVGAVYAPHIADGYLYIPRHGVSINSITRIPLDDPSAPEEVFVSDTGGILSLTDRGDWIYGANINNRSIIRVHKVTKEKETFLSGLSFTPFGLTFGADNLLYIATWLSQSIVRYDGSTFTNVLTGLPGSVSSIRQDAQGYFYISMQSNGVRKYTADFSSYVTVSESATDNIWSLSLTPGGGLVYAKYGTNQIYRLQTGATLSGTPDKSHLGDHPVTIRATNAIGHTDQSFTITVVDGTAPVISSSSPADEATGVDLQPTLSLTFDEEVVLSTTGTLKLMDGATVLRSYDLSIPAEKAAFTLSGDQKTLSWTVDTDLPLNTLVAVEISAGFVKDLAGNDFAGMTAASGEWNFTTLNITPDANGVLYVKKGGAGNKSGDSWANAIAELATALKAAASIPAIEEIWVSGGTYKPMYSPRDGANFADEGRDNAFLMVKDVKVYGGFAGTEGTLEERDLSLTANTSILSGDFNDNDAVSGSGATLNIVNNSDNAHHVVISAGDAGTAVLNGFTIKGGNANESGQFIVNGIIIERNAGGGLRTATSAASFANLLIVNNFGEYGGGIAGTYNSQDDYTNIVVGNNSAFGGGGIYINGTSDITLTNLSIAGNKGGPGFLVDSSSPTVQNSIVWGNSDGGIVGNNTQVSYSIVQEDWAGTGNLNANPLFIDVENGNYTLSATSPALNAGDNILFSGLDANTKDLAGNDRVYQFGSGGEIDMGAYEFQGDAIPAVMSVSVPANGTYGTNDVLEFTVTFNQAVTVDISGSTPYLSLVIGTDNVQAEYVSGSGTNTLTFRYTVQPGDQAPSGISLGTAIEGGDLGTAEPDLNGAPATAGILVDGGTVPQITSTPTLTIPYGQPYEYSITATGGEVLPTTLTAEVLPAWLDFSPGDASEATAFGNIPAGKYIIGVAGDDQGNVYAITFNGTEIYKIAPDGNTSLWKSGLTSGTVYALHIADGYLYIPRHGVSINSITRIPLDDPSAPEETFVSEDMGISSLTDQGDWIYGTNNNNKSIIRVHKVTKEKETVVSGLSVHPFGLTFGADNLLYIATSDSRSIIRYDGSTFTNVLTGLPGYVSSIRQDAQGYFYISMQYNGVRKYTADFSSFVTVSASATDDILSLSLTPGGGLVYAKYGTNQIYRLQTGATLSGTPDKSHLGDHPVTIRATNVIGHTDQSFTITVVDGTAPVISNSSPADEATGINLQPTLSLTFDEEVVLSTTGTLKLMDGATVLRSYDLSIPAEKAAFTLSGDQKTLSWTVDTDLPLNTLVAVEISAGFVKDLAGNDFAGMTAASGEWNFTTINIQPDADGVLYVKKGGAGNQTGDSWGNAVGELADALKAAKFNTDIQQIWVASGTYAPMYSPRDGANFADEIEDNSFLLVKDVEIYGGFEGTEVLLTDRDPKKLLFENGTYLDGILYHSTPTSKIHARHVVISAGDVGSAKLDGFFITNGNSQGASGSITANGISNISRADGAGLYLRASSPKLSNLYIHNNKAQSSGGGMVNADGSSPDINNVLFFSNETYTAHGGAIANFDNTAPHIKNTYIIGNIARGNGGAVYNGTSSSPFFLNSTIYMNASLTAGIHNVNATVEFQNSIITQNLKAGDLSDLNQVVDIDTVNIINISSTVTYKYSLVQGSSEGWSDLGTDGGNNIDSELLFQNIFQLTENSPVIGKGSNALYQAAGGDPENDLDIFGNPRIFNSHAGGNIDIGAEEFQSLIAPVLSNFANISKTYGDADFILTTPTSTSAGSITYSSSDTDVATVDGNTVTIVGAGTITITASQSGTGDYLAGDIELELTVDKALLEITAEPATKVYGAADPALTYSVTGYQYSDNAGIITGALSRNAGENVGTYTINQGTLDAGGNYDISFTTDQLTITKATLNVVAQPQTKVYGAADPALTYSVTGYQHTDDAGIFSGSLERDAGENIGNYAITQGSLAAGDNYDISFTADQLTITKATLNVTANPQTKVDGAADPALTYSVTGYQYSDDADIITGALSRDAGENAGTYAITQGSLAAGDNYDISFTADQLTITKATLNVTANPQTKVYGAADPTLTYSVTGYQYSDNGSSITGALSRTAGENVGTYAITQGSLAAGDNYDISFTADQLTITKATLSVTANPQTKVYGAADPALTYSVTGYHYSDNAGIITGALSRNAGENVGTYTINQGTLDAGGNYDISFTTDQLTITKATLNVVAQPQTKVYGAVDPALTYSVTGYQHTDDAGIFSGSLERDAGENIGNYAITQGSLAAGDNYDISFTADQLTITKATLQISANPQTKVYGAADPALTYSVTGYQYNDDEDIITGSLSRDAGENAGTYAITQGSLAAGDNYDISFTADQLTITKATLSVTANPQTKVYGAADPALTYAVTGYQHSDNGSSITGALSRTAGENVGTYSINRGTLGAGGNYDISFTADQLTITKATLNITANPQTKVYGAADPALTYAVTGYQHSDNANIITGSLSRNAGENVGTYAINQGSLGAGDNYDISFTADQLTITKATLNVTANPQTKVYGAADPALTYSVTGYQYSDNANIITGSLSRDTGENVGSYSITQGSLNAGTNYNIAYISNDLTITVATRTLTFAALPEKTFGNPDFAPGARSSSSEAIIYSSSNTQVAQIIDGNIRIIGAGTATITATVPQNSNYAQQPTASQQLTVHKAPQIITLSAPAEVRRDAGAIALQVASTSGLAVTLSVDDPLVATIHETNMQIHRLGTVIITANQPGNNNYLPATPVSLTVRVVQASEVEQDPKSDGDDIAIRIHPAMSPNGDGINDFMIIEGIRDFPDNKVTIFNRNGTILWQANGYNNSSVVFNGILPYGQKLPAGTYFYIVEVRDGGVWKAKKSYFIIRY